MGGRWMASAFGEAGKINWVVAGLLTQVSMKFT